MNDIIHQDETLETLAQDYIKDLNRPEQHELRQKLYDALYREMILGEEIEETALDEDLKELYEEFHYLSEEVEPAYLRAELFHLLHDQFQKEKEKEKMSWIAQHADDVRNGVKALDIPDWMDEKADWVDGYESTESWVEKKE